MRVSKMSLTRSYCRQLLLHHITRLPWTDLLLLSSSPKLANADVNGAPQKQPRQQPLSPSSRFLAGPDHYRERVTPALLGNFLSPVDQAMTTHTEAYDGRAAGPLTASANLPNHFSTTTAPSKGSSIMLIACIAEQKRLGLPLLLPKEGRCERFGREGCGGDDQPVSKSNSPGGAVREKQVATQAKYTEPA